MFTADRALALQFGEELDRPTGTIDTLFDQYIQWVEDTMTTERQPWLQVVAVLIRKKDGS